jgi:hypothetical protein
MNRIVNFFLDLYNYSSFGRKSKTIELHQNFESLIREDKESYVKGKFVNYTRLPENSKNPEYLFGIIKDDEQLELLFQCDCDDFEKDEYKDLIKIINDSINNNKTVKLEGKIDRNYQFHLQDVDYLN